MKLAEAKVGDTLTGYYALRKVELLPFTGGVRLLIELSDSTGKIAGIVWDEQAEVAHMQIKDAEVVKVKGAVGSYKGALQLQVEKIRPAKSEEFDISELLPQSKHSQEELEAGIEELIEMINDEELKQLTRNLLDDEKIRPLYFAAPGGKQWHHPYLRGLAEHSLSMAQLAVVVCNHYSFLDSSLMIAGALLHDIGKIEEYKIGSTFDYSADGRLFGHITIGYELVKGRATELGINEDLNVRKLLHLILSHQGKKEFSVPVEPMFEEAFALHFIDEIDSKLNAITRIRNKPENEGNEFSEWVKLLETYLFLPRKEHKRE